VQPGHEPHRVRVSRIPVRSTCPIPLFGMQHESCAGDNSSRCRQPAGSARWADVFSMRFPPTRATLAVQGVSSFALRRRRVHGSIRCSRKLRWDNSSRCHQPAGSARRADDFLEPTFCAFARHSCAAPNVAARWAALGIHSSRSVSSVGSPTELASFCMTPRCTTSAPSERQRVRAR